MTTRAACQQCGAAIDGALFCPRCGVDVSGQPSEIVDLPVGGATQIRATMQRALRDATLGEYDILAELGRGGMATVFLAHDIALDRRVAVKVVAPHLFEGEGMVERFKLEARTAAQLSHPHIIPIYAVRESAATIFFVMKFIEGRPLDSIIKKLGPLPIPMVKDTLTRIGGALGYAHRRDVVHRDVKPGNIMIDEEGSPIMTDFGIAKVAQAKGLTATGAAIGTPSYMSPEQCEGRDVTGASDQYSLGIVAFEMLTGRLPFTGDSAFKVMYKHCQDPLPSLEDFRPDCPPDLRETVSRMVAKDPADRWPSLEAAVQKLGAHATLSYHDPVRTQMIAIVKEGDHREILARIRTPRSPVPRVATRAGAHAPGHDPTRGTKRRTMLIAAAVVVVLGAGAVAMLRPWRGADASGAAGDLPEVGSGVAGEAGGAAPASVTAGVGPGGDAPTGGQDAAGASEPTAEAAGTVAGLSSATPPAEGGTAAPPSAEAAPEPAGGQPVTPPGPAVASMRITGLSGPLLPDASVALAATGLDASGAPLGPLSPAWASSDPAVARVTSDGVVSAAGPGVAIITASLARITSEVSVTVLAEPVVAVAVRPGSLALTVGESATLSAAPTSAGGRALAGRAVTWASGDARTVAVTQAGVVRALAPGSVAVTATSEGVSASVTVSVAAPPVSTRTAIEEAIQSYARALEARDIERVRLAYPGITAQQERQLAQALELMNELRAELRVDAVEEAGDRATADVSGTYTYVNASTRRQERAAISFRAIFERGPEGWRLVETR